jgi:hypothetical protein
MRGSKAREEKAGQGSCSVDTGLTAYQPARIVCISQAVAVERHLVS